MTILQQFNITTIAIVELDTSAAPSTYALPDITPFQQGIWVKDATGNAGTNNVTISHSTLLIDGAASYLLATNYRSVLFVSDGARIIVHDGRGIAAGDLSDTGGPATWAPTDQSGAGLTFANVAARVYKLGNIIYTYGTLTYPATADGSVAKISLPVAVPNQGYANAPGAVLGSAGAAGLVLQANANTSTATFRVTPGGGVTNVSLSGAVISFMLIYPAS